MARRRMRGAAAVELAIVLLPLLVLAFGTTEIGRALYYYNQAVAATRDATRYLTMVGEDQGADVARCLAVFGRGDCGGTPIVPGLTTDMVHIEYTHNVDTGEGSVDLVSVRIEALPYTSLVPWVVRNMTFDPIATAMRHAA
jgi:Flp pilus assembly protein TadG